MSITREHFANIVDKQRQYFRSGETRDIKFRIKMLKKLKDTIKKYEVELIEALKKDLRKSEFEAFTSEIGIVYSEITHTLKHIRKWAKRKRVRTELVFFPARSYIQKEPHGTTLIIAPWNYPFQLAIAPLIGAIAAGNTAVLKPSEYALEVRKVVARIIDDAFPDEYIQVVKGAVEETTLLLDLDFDYIFFTGSVPVGKIVMAAAAKRLTPVTLELGGKSPVIVDETANLRLAARKTVWGKFFNAGQTCVAPDYLLVAESRKEELLKELKATIEEFYEGAPQKHEEYSRIINKKHFDRLISLFEPDQVFTGGESDPEDLYIAPTVLDKVEWTDKVMDDEIFGPILPVLTFKSIDEAIDLVNSRPKPLALYLFTRSKENEKKVTEQISYGGGAINATLVHLTSPYLPFGGAGSSGQGSYHGQASFDAFSHSKSLMKHHHSLDLPLTYPHKKVSLGLLRKIFK